MGSLAPPYGGLTLVVPFVQVQIVHIVQGPLPPALEIYPDKANLQYALFCQCFSRALASFDSAADILAYCELVGQHAIGTREAFEVALSTAIPSPPRR